MDPDTGEVKVQISPREPWLHLEEFMNVPENKRQDDRQIYFIRTIKLFSNLCLVSSFVRFFDSPWFKRELNWINNTGAKQLYES